MHLSKTLVIRFALQASVFARCQMMLTQKWWNLRPGGFTMGPFHRALSAMKRSPRMFRPVARKQESPKKIFRRCLGLRVGFVLSLVFLLSPLIAAAEEP
jgi:hypothetical protein